MFRKTVTAVGIMFLAASTLPADFSYQETSTITGGTIASMMKVVGVFSKSAREPIRSTVSVKGDKMVTRNQNTATVIDLNAGTFTEIDLRKKTYTVMTFDEVKRAAEEALAKAKKEDAPEMKFKVSVDNTGKSKQVAGLEAKEMILKMEMEGKDQKSGETGAMAITMDMWIAPSAPGFAEVRDFQKRLAEKIAWTTSGNMFMAQPEISKGMAEAAKEMSKLDGMPVLQTVTMGAAVQPGAAEAQAAQQEQQPERQEQQAERPSIGGALGRLGGIRGLGRKSSEPKQEDKKATAPGTLLEMTVETTNFSSAAVSDSEFAVPAGFKKVDPKK